MGAKKMLKKLPIKVFQIFIEIFVTETYKMDPGLVSSAINVFD